MNAHDRQNFNFIVSLSRAELEAFFEELPEDEIRYAIELIKQAQTELILKEHELIDEEQTDLVEAKLVLARIIAL